MVYLNCNLCNKNDFKILRINGIYKLVKCKNCGLVFVNPQPQRDNLFKHYNEKYYAPWLKDQFYARGKMWKSRLKKVQMFKRGGKLLDVGCACGIFLNEVKHNGFQAYGTEVSEYAVKYAKDAFGIEVFKGGLKDANYLDNFFDVITFWHVLEHTTDPLDNLIEVKRILKTDGVLILAVPNFNNYIYRIAYTLVRLKQPKLCSIKDREIHLYYFSINTLKKMLENVGFNIIKFNIDKERIFFGGRILDTAAWILYKIVGINFGMAFETYAKKVNGESRDYNKSKL